MKILELCIYNKIEKLTKCTIVGVRLISVGKGDINTELGKVEEYCGVRFSRLRADSLPSEPQEAPDWN